uniref:C-type lectin domain-containing protein n=1 Tax=Panagrolaimus superbus TaxID=310955 RepID=A0A914Y5E1_9BILA
MGVQKKNEKVRTCYLYMMSANVWTGIYSPDSGRTWKTSDETEVDFLKYANWCSDRPAVNISGQRCVTFSCCSCYYDLDCSNTAQHALCKKPIF